MIERIGWILVISILIAFDAGRAPAMAAETSGDEGLAQAEARIERHRKADGTVLVVDAAGRPLPGASIKIEQTRHKFLFGCNIFWWGPEEDRYRKGGDQRHQAAYRSQFESLFNYATVPFYWMYYEPRPGGARHAYMDTLVKWCGDRGIAVKGHPLAWNWYDPSWLPTDSEDIHRRQLARIDECVARFAGRIERWDVVNEAAAYDRPKFVSEISPKYSAMWKKVGRMELARECFAHARKANPKAILLINDFQLDQSYEQVIEQLVDEQGKRLYDVIGLQSHMGSKVWPNDKIWQTCETFARFGVPLHFTEASITSGGNAAMYGPNDPRNISTPEGEARQAREIVRFYTVVFSHPAVEAITWWDFCDWSMGGLTIGLVRKDMSKKPAYDELKQLIKSKWWTTTSAQADAAGRAAFRGFHGHYRVTVDVAGKEVVVKDVLLDNDHTTPWLIKVE
jgi:GH35 family endo-1,4-beta-xylanase